jgi:hypothetical protein
MAAMPPWVKACHMDYENNNATRHHANSRNYNQQKQT